MRAPALAEGDADEIGGNPLLWRLGRYRRRGRLAYSPLVLRHAAFGLLLAGIVLGLPTVASTLFASDDFNLIASVAVGLHILWISVRTCYRMDGLLATSFFDEMMLTAMSPREIASALAQSVSRPVFASLAATLLPVCAFQVGSVACGGTCATARSAFVFWGVLSPFVALTVFAVPWLVMWESFAGPARSLPIKLVVYAWPSALPMSAAMGNAAISAATAGVLAFLALNAALVLAPRVPAMLADREKAPSGGKSFRLSEACARRAARV